MEAASAGEYYISSTLHRPGKPVPPVTVHRKGSNVKNGVYYVDQNIEKTIGHYSSAAYINIDALKEAYARTLTLSKEEVTKDSPLVRILAFL